MTNSAPTHFAGIDPGLDGAIGLYNPVSQWVGVYRMPTFTIKKGGRQQRVLDLTGLQSQFQDIAWTVGRVTIEEVHAMPGQGVSSMFKFGFNAGAVQAMCAAHELPVRLVSPAKWKGAMQLTASKDGARKLASEMFPRSAGLWARVKDDGAAEAVLLAVYGYRLSVKEGAA